MALSLAESPEGAGGIYSQAGREGVVVSRVMVVEFGLSANGKLPRPMDGFVHFPDSVSVKEVISASPRILARALPQTWWNRLSPFPKEGHFELL